MCWLRRYVWRNFRSSSLLKQIFHYRSRRGICCSQRGRFLLRQYESWQILRHLCIQRNFPWLSQWNHSRWSHWLLWLCGSYRWFRPSLETRWNRLSHRISLCRNRRLFYWPEAWHHLRYRRLLRDQIFSLQRRWHRQNQCRRVLNRLCCNQKGDFGFLSER